MTNARNGSRPDDDRRERIIRNILDRRTSMGSGVGIFGAKVCQLCGEIGSFRGLAGAMASHFVHDFVAIQHEHGSRESRRDALRDQPYRFCERCRARVTPAAKVGSQYVCGPCRRRLPADSADLRDALKELERRRFIDREIGDDERLRRFDLSLEADRLELEEMYARGMDRFKLETERTERWREALRRLGQVHGVDYEPPT